MQGFNPSALHDSESDHAVRLDRDDRIGAFQSAGNAMALQIFPYLDQVPLRRVTEGHHFTRYSRYSCSIWIVHNDHPFPLLTPNLG